MGAESSCRIEVDGVEAGAKVLLETRLDTLVDAAEDEKATVAGCPMRPEKVQRRPRRLSRIGRQQRREAALHRKPEASP